MAHSSMLTELLFLKRENSEMSWSSVVCKLASLSPCLSDFAKVMPTLPIDAKKLLLKATRCQCVPSEEMDLYIRYCDTWKIEFIVPPSTTGASIQSNILTLARSIQNEMHHPILSGLVSQLIRCSPIAEDQMATIVSEGISKEVSAMTSPSHPECLNYSAFMGDFRDSFASLASNIPPRPMVSADIHQSMLYAKRSLATNPAPIFPRISTKTCGRETLVLYNDARRHLGLLEVKEVTTQDLERLYHETGLAIVGATEMRWSWKYGELKPRVYYAQGGQAYHASKFVQPIWNTIVDSFPVTHRHNRYNPPAEYLLEDEDLVVYDYASFTSALDEMICFVRMTANFMDDVEISVVDGYHGPIFTTIGDLLRDWIDITGMGHIVDMSAVLGMKGYMAEWITAQNVPLGIAGDITSCTCLHGIHVCYVVGSTRKCRCIGDDARIHVHCGVGSEELDSQLQNLGTASVEKGIRIPYKSELDEDVVREVWDYAKRPITRMENRVLTGDCIFWPALENIFDLSDGTRGHKFPVTRSQRITSYSMQVTRFLAQLSYMEVSEDTKHIVHEYHLMAMRQLFSKGKWPKRYGWVESPSGKYLAPPIFTADQVGSDLLSVIVPSFGLDELVRVRKVGGPSCSQLQWVSGEEFEYKVTPGLNYMEKMGYLARELLFENVSRDMIRDDNLFLDLLLGKLPAFYSYRIITEPPEWLISLAGIQ